MFKKVCVNPKNIEKNLFQIKNNSPPIDTS